MKKLFTSFAAMLLCAAASSAAITVTVDGKPVEDGSTIKWGADDFESMAIGPFFRFTAEADFVIKADDAPIKFTLLSDDGNGFGFCPDVCYAPNDDGNGVYTASGELKKKENTVSIHKEYVMVQSLPKSKCYMSVQLEQGNDEFVFLIEVDTESAGINGIGTASGATFANNVVSYNLAAPAQLSVFSITGTAVLSRTISGNGSVDLSVLPKGVYIYTVAGKATRVLVK